MAQKKWLGLLGALPILAMGFTSHYIDSDQDARGSETVKVQPHHSRWDYPKEVTVGPGQRLHIVERGDTLWDLGQKYLGNPYAWPQIWELNQWVHDPHWIFPGDPLLISISSVFGQGGLAPDPAGDIANLQPDSRFINIPDLASRIGYAYTFHDYLQLPYLVPKGANAHFRELGAIRITGQQPEIRSNMSKGGVVYLGGGQDRGLQVGDRMLVLKVAKARLTHPDNRVGQRSIGDVIQQVGVLRVLTVHPRNAEAVVEDSIDGIDIGDYATAFVEPVLISHKDAKLREDLHEPIPLNTSAKIIYGRNDAAYFGTGALVIIDKGSSAGRKVGDMLLAVSTRQLVSGAPNSMASRSNPQTNKYLGQLLVVRVDDNSSTCLILHARSEMSLGDVVTD